MKVFITGATGFVGHALTRHLIHNNHEVLAGVRAYSAKLPAEVEQVVIGDLVAWAKDGEELSLDYLNGVGSRSVFRGAEVVVHTAARVHIMDELAEDPLAEFRQVNTLATLSLACQAAREGVKRFVFISSIKVNGESTTERLPFSEKDDCQPSDPYGISKWEAEQGLMQIANKTNMEVVIIRPPLVYGPGVKGNFASMAGWVARGIPLPLGAVRNKRSLLALENLVSFIICSIDHPKAANQVFVLSDGEDISTSELIQKLAHSQGKKAKLLFIPVPWMKFAASMLGKSDVTERLFGSLQLDSSKAHYLLGWSPIISMNEQLKNMHDMER